MDSLYHFVMSLVGGYVFFSLSKRKMNPILLVVVSLLSLLTDLDHVVESQFFHNLFFLVPPFFVFLYSSVRRRERLQLYSVVFSLMVFGHLLADMTYGIGIRFLYPLSDQRFVLPRFFMEPNFISGFGFTVAAYFIAVVLAAYLFREK